MKKLLYTPILLIAAMACESEDQTPIDTPAEPTCFELGMAPDSVLTFDYMSEGCKIATNVSHFTIDSIWFRNNTLEERCYRLSETIENGGTISCEWLTLYLLDKSIAIETDSINDYATKHYTNSVYDNFIIFLTSAGESHKIQGIKQRGPYIEPEYPFEEMPSSLEFPADGASVTITGASTPKWFIMNATVDGKEFTGYYFSAYGSSEHYDCQLNWLNIRRDGENLTLTAEANTDPRTRTFTLSLWSTANNGIMISGTQQGS